jgi:hypothetical protein
MTGFNLVRFIRAIEIGAKETDCETRGHFCDFAKVRGAMNMLHSSLCCFRVKNMKASFRRVQQSAFVSTKWKSRFSHSATNQRKQPAPSPQYTIATMGLSCLTFLCLRKRLALLATPHGHSRSSSSWSSLLQFGLDSSLFKDYIFYCVRYNISYN